MRRYLPAMAPLALLLALAGAPDTTFGAVVMSHVARYPAMTVSDLYKLTHQAAFGAEHAIPDSATAAAKRASCGAAAKLATSDRRSIGVAISRLVSDLGSL